MKHLIPLLYIGLTLNAAETFDTVIANGRVMDPQTGLDAIRHVGISKGTISAISKDPLKGRITINGKRLLWM